MGGVDEIKVLYISHERKMGGANLSLLDLVCEMKKRGVEVFVAVLYRGCPIDIRLRERGIETIPCLYGWWQQPANWNILFKGIFRGLHLLQFLSVRKMCRFIKKRNIGIIHSNSSTIDIGIMASRITGCKHVYHFREFGKEDYNLEFMYDRKRVVDRINRESDCNIFISSALAASYDEIDNKIVIYDGIEKNNFDIDACKKKEEEVVRFLISGNIIAGKNQMLVLKAVNELNKKGLKNKISISVAGCATDMKESREYKKQLMNYAKKYELENVEFLGYVNDMKKLRQNIDVEIIASKCEAYGRVTVEAMAAGHLVIASDSGANSELIENHVTGLIFDNGSYESLAKQMEYVIYNRAECNEMGNAAFNYALNEHSSEKNDDKVYSTYRLLLNEQLYLR